MIRFLNWIFGFRSVECVCVHRQTKIQKVEWRGNFKKTYLTLWCFLVNGRTTTKLTYHYAFHSFTLTWFSISNFFHVCIIYRNLFHSSRIFFVPFHCCLFLLLLMFNSFIIQSHSTLTNENICSIMQGN